MGLHARLALAHRPEELTLFRAQYILRYSGDARKPSLQLRGPVKDKGVSRSSANWAVSTTKAEPAGCVDKVSQQQGVLTMRSGHLCLPPYTARSLPVWVPAASFWSLKPPLSVETVGIYVLCTVKGLERKTSIFLSLRFTLFLPLSLEVLPEQGMNSTIKTLHSCVKEKEIFFQKGSSDVSAQGNSRSKEGHIDFSNKSIFKWGSLTPWSFWKMICRWHTSPWCDFFFQTQGAFSMSTV